MQYREFGKDKRSVSVLGFGCMRLPTIDGEPNGEVDEKEATRMVRHAIDNGVNYVDSAKVYHNGQADAIVGRILQDGYRDRVAVATKLPVWDIQSVQDADRIFDEQRRDLQTEKIDVYLLHNLQRGYWDTCRSCDLFDWARKKKEKGEIGYIGFSFHDDYNFFVELVNAFEGSDFCQLQYNYAGVNTQAGQQGVRYAAEKGLSVVVMEPLLGGGLAQPKGRMGEIFKRDNPENLKPVDLAFRWLWDQPEISVVLSGMSTFQQVEENLRAAEKEPGLFESERNLIEKLQNAYDQSTPIKCTKCRYCMPCPNDVDIPLNFDLYNSFAAMGELDKNAELNKLLYVNMKPEHRADHCVQCGACEEKCPQHLPIETLLADVRQTLGNNV